MSSRRSRQTEPEKKPQAPAQVPLSNQIFPSRFSAMRMNNTMKTETKSIQPPQPVVVPPVHGIPVKPQTPQTTPASQACHPPAIGGHSMHRVSVPSQKIPHTQQQQQPQVSTRVQNFDKLRERFGGK